MKVYIITRKKRTPEGIERRAKIRELLQVSNISSMADIQNLFKETIAEFMENSLDAELDDELGYSTTIQPVRRTFPNSTIHIVSNTGLLTKSNSISHIAIACKKKDAQWRQDVAQIIRLRFKAVAERRQ